MKKKKLSLSDLKVKSFVTDQDKLGGLRANHLIDLVAAETDQTECYHCDSVGQGCSAPCN